MREARARGAAVRVVWLAVAAMGCSSPEPPPPTPGGPAFLINSPADGGSLAGVTWFSVQPTNPAQVASVAFAAGGKDLGTDATAADGYKVFLAAKDYPAGPLTLAATVTGTDGKVQSHTVSVTNVPNPPSTATVEVGGVVLGAAELDGSISTLTIAPGDAMGATVTFATRTKEQVKTATGVDYDALGVTFLGAQEIGSTKPFAKPLLVTSGGFGPRVQPGQVVVQYRIAPDADGDGKGELVVINTASVAPNGDVISDPIARATGEPAAVGTGGGHAPGPSGGPPGTLLAFSVTGFNPSSVGGNIASWSCAMGVTTRISGTVRPSGSSPTAQVFYTIIPACPPGPATVTLINSSTGASAGPFAVTITAAPAVPNPGAAVAHGIGQLATFFNALPTTGNPPVDNAVAAARALLASPPASIPDATPGEGGIAANPDVSGDPPSHEGGAACFSEAERHFLLGRHDAYAAQAEAAGDANPERRDYYRALAWADAHALLEVPSCEGDPPPACAPSATAGAGITGMGSAPPPGGSACGSASPPPPAPGPGKPGSTRSAAAVEEQPGRVVVRVLVDGQVVPFSGASDAGGFFFIPFIPEGRAFTAIAFDTQTGQSRSVRGVGPATGHSVRMFFDFLAQIPGNVSGTVRDADGPVAGVKVRALVDPTNELSVAAEATTDAAGTYRLPPLPDGVQLLESRSLNHARTVQTLPPGDAEVTADFMLTRLAPSLRQAKVYVILSGIQASDDAVMEALRAGGQQPTRGAGILDFDGTQADLGGFDAVVLLGQYLPSTFDFMPAAGVNAIVAYVSGGGGLVTGEWVNWKVSKDIESPLFEIMPVTAGGPQSVFTSTYSLATADDVIDRDLPASFTFTPVAYDGQQAFFTLKAGATSFFTDSATHLSGLAGWDYQLGRVVSFSTIIGDNPLTNSGPLRMFEYQQLFINAVSWAARSAE